jgi:hypothetical protein
MCPTAEERSRAGGGGESGGCALFARGCRIKAARREADAPPPVTGRPHPASEVPGPPTRAPDLKSELGGACEVGELARQRTVELCCSGFGPQHGPGRRFSSSSSHGAPSWRRTARWRWRRRRTARGDVKRGRCDRRRRRGAR